MTGTTSNVVHALACMLSDTANACCTMCCGCRCFGFPACSRNLWVQLLRFTPRKLDLHTPFYPVHSMVVTTQTFTDLHSSQNPLIIMVWAVAIQHQMQCGRDHFYNTT